MFSAKKISGRISCGVLALCLILAAGCGKNGKTGDGGDSVGTGGAAASEARWEDQAPKWQYEAKELPLALEQSSLYSVKQIGDDLYYPVSGSDDGTCHIYKYSVQKGETEELPAAFADGSVLKFDIGEDGSVYIAATCWGGDNIGQKLEKYDAGGELVYSTDITELLNDSKEGDAGYLLNLIVDGEGRACVASSKMFFFFDVDGKFVGKVDPFEGKSAGNNSMVCAVGRAADGRIYACVSDEKMNCSLLELDLAKKTAAVAAGQFIRCNGTEIGRGCEKDFLVNDGTTVYEYDLAGGTGEAVFSWSDSGIAGNGICSVGALSDGNILAVQADPSAGKGSVLLMTRLAPGEKPAKEELVLGCMTTPSTVVEKAVAEFNRNSDKYHLTIKKYMDGEWSDAAKEEALTKLNLEIAAGNGPDILDIYFLLQNGETLARKGVLEDLSPWLEKSGAVSRDDFFASALDACTVDGKLFYLPKQFTLQAAAGWSADVGNDPGWTLDEFMEFADSRPDAEVFDRTSELGLLFYCLQYTIESYVDLNAGKCNFESPEFVRLLEFAGRHGSTGANDGDSAGSRIQSGRLLLESGNISSFMEIQKFDNYFAGEECVIGYPTPDGAPASALYLNEAGAILAASAHKEGAFAYLESFVTAEIDRDMFSFPAVKYRFEEQIEEERAKTGQPVYQKDGTGKYLQDENGELVPEYLLDKNGDPRLDKDGNPIQKFVTYEVNFSDGWTMEGHPVLDEEVDELRQIIDAARPFPYEYGEIRKLIGEETEDFFQGSKSAQQVAGVIQNRAQLYLNENQ